MAIRTSGSAVWQGAIRDGKGAISTRSGALDKEGDGYAIKSSHLTLTATIPGADDGQFQEIAAAAKAGCPVSKVLTCEITLVATLG